MSKLDAISGGARGGAQPPAGVESGPAPLEERVQAYVNAVWKAVTSSCSIAEYEGLPIGRASPRSQSPSSFRSSSPDVSEMTFKPINFDEGAREA